MTVVATASMVEQKVRPYLVVKEPPQELRMLCLPSRSSFCLASLPSHPPWREGQKHQKKMQPAQFQVRNLKPYWPSKYCLLLLWVALSQQCHLQWRRQTSNTLLFLEASPQHGQRAPVSQLHFSLHRHWFHLLSQPRTSSVHVATSRAFLGASVEALTVFVAAGQKLHSLWWKAVGHELYRSQALSW